MKKIFTLMTMAVLTVTLFTGCDTVDNSDRREARTLEGTWTGTIDSYYTDRWGLVGNTYRTTMRFFRDNAYGGTGYEVDYDYRSPYDDYYYCEFQWTVDYGDIIIRYADSWNDVYICDYALYSDYFEGYMDDGTRRNIYFQLYYDGKFDWSRYRYDWAPTRSVVNSRCHASGVFANTINNTPQK